jgi:hypothetical protein
MALRLKLKTNIILQNFDEIVIEIVDLSTQSSPQARQRILYKQTQNLKH